MISSLNALRHPRPRVAAMISSLNNLRLFLVSHSCASGSESCEALLPEMEELFDAVLADSDEACSSVKKMKKKIAELTA